MTNLFIVSHMFSLSALTPVTGQTYNRKSGWCGPIRTIFSAKTSSRRAASESELRSRNWSLFYDFFKKLKFWILGSLLFPVPHGRISFQKTGESSKSVPDARKWLKSTVFQKIDQICSKNSFEPTNVKRRAWRRRFWSPNSRRRRNFPGEILQK